MAYDDASLFRRCRLELQLFALKSTGPFGQSVSEYLQIPLAQIEERDFEDGEHKSRPLENVRGRDVFVLQSLYEDHENSVNDKLIRLLFFIGALREASAGQITVVLPYCAYARKDRQTKDRDPVTTKYLAQILESSGASQVMTMDVHNLAAFQNAFRIPTDHLEARVLFAPFFAHMAQIENLVVVSPDAGGVKRTEKFRETLEEISGKKISKAFLEKTRSEGVISGAENIIGDVQGKVAIIIDDIIGSGHTIKRAIDALDQAGANKIYACATHGLFVGDAHSMLAHPKLEKLIITNSIPPFRLHKKVIDEKIVVIDCAPLFAKAMKRIQAGDSLADLLQHYPQSILDTSLLS